LVKICTTCQGTGKRLIYPESLKIPLFTVCSDCLGRGVKDNSVFKFTKPDISQQSLNSYI